MRGLRLREVEAKVTAFILKQQLHQTPSAHSNDYAPSLRT
jgi:hypothetical protein